MENYGAYNTATRTPCVPEEVKKASQIETALMEIDRQIDRYRENLDRLVLKLSAILPPPAPEKVSACGEALCGPLCPLAEAMEDKAHKLRLRNNMLCDLISLIQL